SLKQANEGEVAMTALDHFDPTLYGMAAEYDEQGNYKYPEGFDPETNEWLPGYEKQREEWERQYAEAHHRWEMHKSQIEAMQPAEATAEAAPAETAEAAEPEEAGTLASDEALQALREKLTGN
ncbi:MAG: 30S ribosomal protein S1, partial [Actinomycetota bacterium]